MMHPNDLFRYLYPSLWAEYYGDKDLPEHELNIGMYALSLRIGHATRLYPILQEVYGPLYGNAIMDYAMYSIMGRTDTTQLFPDRMTRKVLFSKEANSGIEIAGVILDRGFCTHDVFQMLKECGYPYDGQDPIVYKYAAPGWDRSGCVISSQTEYPEEALRWVDYIYDKVNSLEMIEGDFGGRLQLQDEGYYIIGEPLEGMDSQYVYRYSLCPGHSGAWCVQEKEYNEVLRLTFTEPRSNFNDEFCAPYYVEPFPPVFYTPEEADEMSSLNTNIISEIARQSCEWMMNGGIEEEWDAYLANLDSVGLQRWLEINEQAAERYNKQ